MYESTRLWDQPAVRHGLETPPRVVARARSPQTPARTARSSPPRARHERAAVLRRRVHAVGAVRRRRARGPTPRRERRGHHVPRRRGPPRARAGAFYTLVPIRPRSRGGRRSLRTFPGASLRPPHAFNPRPRRLSTSTDAYEPHPAQFKPLWAARGGMSLAMMGKAPSDTSAVTTYNLPSTITELLDAEEYLLGASRPPIPPR